jgi:hypothetical protein
MLAHALAWRIYLGCFLALAGSHASTTSVPCPAPAGQYGQHTLTTLRALVETRRLSTASESRLGRGALLAAQSLAEQLLALDTLPDLLRDTNVLASLHAPRVHPANQSLRQTGRHPRVFAPIHMDAGEFGAVEGAFSHLQAQPLDARNPKLPLQLHRSPCPSPSAQLVATATPATVSFTMPPAMLVDECGWQMHCLEPAGSMLLLNFTQISLPAHFLSMASNNSLPSHRYVQASHPIACTGKRVRDGVHRCTYSADLVGTAELLPARQLGVEAGSVLLKIIPHPSGSRNIRAQVCVSTPLSVALCTLPCLPAFLPPLSPPGPPSAPLGPPRPP